MKYKILALCILAAFASSAQTPTQIGKKENYSYTPGMLRVDSVFSLMLTDTASTKAAYPSYRMEGRLAYQNGLHYRYVGGKFILWGGGSGGGVTDSTIFATQFFVSNYPTTPLWSNIQSKPSSFPPSAHTHSLSDLTQSGATSGQAAVWNGAAWVPTTVSGGGGSTDTSSLNYRINTKANRDSTATALATKQPTLVSTTNIKSINGSSILGSGDLTVGGTNYSAGANILFTGSNPTVISAIGSSSYADSAKVASMAALDPSYRGFYNTLDRSGFTGSNIPTGNYYAPATNLVGNGRKFESLHIAATGTGNIVIGFFSNVAGVCNMIYAETTAVASTGDITIAASSLSIPDPTFAGYGDVYVGVRVLTAGIYAFSSSGSLGYYSPVDNGAVISAGTGLELGLSITYSQASAITSAVIANSQIRPVSIVSDLIARISAGQKNLMLDTGTFILPSYVNLPSGTNLTGSGKLTIVKTGANIYGFYVGIATQDVTISNMTLDGGYLGYLKGTIASPYALASDSNSGTHYGIYSDQGINVVVRNVNFINYDKCGLFSSGGGGSAPKPNRLIAENCYFFNNYYGLKCESEYSLISRIRADSNVCGIAVGAGNINVSHSLLASNTVDGFMYSAGGGSNDSHAGWSNVAFNHGDSSKGGGLFVYNTHLEERFTNCSFYEGNITLFNTYGVSFSNCGISGTFKLYYGVGTKVVGCTFVDAYRKSTDGIFNLFGGATVYARLNTFNDATFSGRPFINTSPPSYISNSAAAAVLPLGEEYYNSTIGANSTVQ